MATAWIQIFILTFAECVAPAGKTVCQEQQFELRFINRADCVYALEQLIAIKATAEHVIVNRQKTGCTSSAVESDTFASLEAINEAYKDTVGWRLPNEDDTRRSVVNKDHRERLAELMTCEETSNVVPCKVGDIIVEDASGDNVEVWKQD